MKRMVAGYWPVALIVPLAVAGWIHAWSSADAPAPLGAGQLTAELARAFSYGLVGGDVKAADRASSASAVLASARRA
ncbi:hypothetical protein CY652_09600 [Burkholderia sp. WAC0059]|nr:hypothetical protein CY652_09600 [Burkholderia sp. WAC0059]